MFTGIIGQLGRVDSVTQTQAGSRLQILAQGWDHCPTPGDSISVNGCCLTVTSAEQGNGEIRLDFDVIPQTLTMTSLGDLNSGDIVNLEHAAMPTTLLGGHIVQGHVDGVGVISKVTDDSSGYRLQIVPPSHLMEYITSQGSIAINGVSLTVASVNDKSFDVALIPETIQRTNLGKVRQHSRVNVEVDCLAKITVEWLRRNAVHDS